MTSQTDTSSPKRVNLKKVLLVTGGLCALAVGIAALDREMRVRRDRQTIEWATQAMKDHRYEEAATQFARAVARHPDDASLSLQSGDAFYALSAEKPEALQKARVAWEAAAAIDPHDLVALRRLLNYHADMALVRPSAEVFRDLGEVAAKIEALAASDGPAATARVISRLGSWFSRSGQPAPADDAAHEKLISALAREMQQSPPEPQAILYYALANARRAAELKRTHTDSSASETLNRAEAAISAAAGDKANSGEESLYRAAEGLAILAQAHQRLARTISLAPAIHVASSQPAATQPTTTEATQTPSPLWPIWDSIDHRVEWDAADAGESHSAQRIEPTTQPADAIASRRCLDEARSIADRAAASAAPSNPRFVDLRLLDAYLAEATGDENAAQKIVSDTVSSRPGSLLARLALANLVSRSHPERALSILDAHEADDDARPGPIALTRRDVLIQANEQQARLSLDAAESTDDPSTRQSNMNRASAACDALVAMLVDDASSLKLVARLRLLQGKYIDAIRATDRAMAMQRAHGQDDVELLSLRASALLAQHEPQAAIESLQSCLEIAPSRSAERLLLARTLLDEGQFAETAEEMAMLQKALGDDVRLLELRVRLLAAQNAYEPSDDRGRQLHDAYGRLPESSVKQQARKAELALLAGEAPDAVRLLQKQSKLPEAPAIRNSLDGATPRERDEARLKDEKAKDVLSAIQTCRTALSAHDLQTASQQIDALTRLRPDSPLLFDLSFDYDLATRNWADAGSCADKLASANFDAVGGQSYLFRLYMSRGRPLAAVPVASRISLQYENAAIGWIDLGEALQSVAQYDRAMNCYHRALAIEQTNLSAIKGLAICLRNEGRAQEADTWIGNGLKIAPADEDLLEMQFVRQLSQGDMRLTIAARQAAMKANPGQFRPAVFLGRTWIQISRAETLSNAQGAREAIGKAREVLAAAVKKWPDDKQCAFWAAHAAALAGDVAEGKQILRRLCDRDGWAKRPEAAQMLMEFCLTWGDLESAQAAMKDAVARGADGAPMARRLATFFMRQQGWQPALDVLRPYTSDPLVPQQRVLISVTGGKGAEVARELRRALEAHPRSARVMALIAVFCSADRNDALARAWLDRAIAAGDDDLARRQRGTLRLLQKDPDLPGAIQDLTVAYEAMQSDPGSAMLLGDARLRSQEESGAERMLQTAVTNSPLDKDARLRLIAVEESLSDRNWDKVTELIDAAHVLSPSDCDWDAAEARMWSSRGDFVRAAGLMRHAMQLATTDTLVADATSQQQGAIKVRALVRDELWMLLEAQAYSAVNSEADAVISRYGPLDMVSAWAHHAKAALQRRTGEGDSGTAEYDSAIAVAQNAAGFDGASEIVETISSEAGADEAIRRIDAYRAAQDAANHGEDSASSPVHDARWDLLRIDLMRRNGEFQAAGAEIDKLMPRLETLARPVQLELLRLAVVVYLQDEPPSQLVKARDACAALLKRTPDDVWALNNMAVLCIQTCPASDAQKTLAYVEKAYRAAERDGKVAPQIADTYGWALVAAGRGSESIDLLKSSAEQLPAAQTEYHLAEAYLSCGDPASAWPCLKTAIQEVEQDQAAQRPIPPDLRSKIAGACGRAIFDILLRGGKPTLAPSPVSGAADSR